MDPQRMSFTARSNHFHSQNTHGKSRLAFMTGHLGWGGLASPTPENDQSVEASDSFDVGDKLGMH